MRTSILTGTLFVFATLAAGAGAATPQTRTALPANLGAPSIYATPTIRQFLAACRGDQGGCMDEIGTALMDKMDYSGGSNVCISSPDYGNAVPKWLDDHPQTASMATEDGIYMAIKSLYPCA